MFRFIKEYFSLSNNEQRGIIGLVLIILFMFIGTRSYFLFQKPKTTLEDNSALFAALYTKKIQFAEIEQLEVETLIEPTITYFTFNPNTASKEEFIALGLKENVANTIINYRSKGGKFYQKEDLLKIYGLEQALYEKLESYIFLPATKANPTWKEYPKETYTPKAEEVAPEVKKEIIEINDADSATLTSIKGIGPVYASRIIKYRNLLGGYLFKEQLLEVYGIDQEVYDKIVDRIKCNGEITSIPVNGVGWKELASHPYIESTTANILLNYIKAHGSIENFDFILESNLLSQEELDKITPYLSIE